jgi:hypothetical protein
MQVLPPETTKRISDIAAQGRTTGSDKTDDKPLDDKPADDKDEPADDNEQVNLDTASAVEKAKALHEGLDGLGTDEEAVLAVLGSIADFKEWNTVKSAFLQLYKQDLQDWLDSDTSFGDQANITAIINRLEKKEADGALTVDEISTSQEAAQGLYDAMKGGTGIGTDEETLLAILGKISTRQFDEVVKAYNKISKGAHVLAHVADELSGTDWDRANGIVKRFGYELLKDDPGFKKLSDASGDPADTGSTGADAGADATPAADKPMTAAELDAIDVNTPEGADKFLKGLISNPELFGQLDAETQQAIKDAVGV